MTMIMTTVQCHREKYWSCDFCGCFQHFMPSGAFWPVPEKFYQTGSKHRPAGGPMSSGLCCVPGVYGLCQAAST